MRFNSNENDFAEEESSAEKEKEKIGTYLIFKLDERLFKFRGQQIPAGHYLWNFTFQIPDTKTPSSFQYITAQGESFSVKYTITVYFKETTPLMT